MPGSIASTPGATGDGLRTYLDVLYGRARAGLLVEVRWRTPGGMAQRFVPAGRLDRVEELLVQRGARTDIYVGVLARWRRGGRRADLAGDARTVWVDLDVPWAARALEPVDPPPSLVVASGTPGHLHAYWRLRAAVAPAVVERANRRLAWALCGDLSSADAARILRAPGTLNFKHEPATPVGLRACRPEPVALGALVGGLADPPGPMPRRGEARPPGRDRLLELEPERWVRALTGQAVSRHRKVRCPFHEDSEPSLHVYADARRGWYCFGCRRGGSVYDFAALLWRRPLRGPGFAELRRDLHDVLLDEGGTREAVARR